MSAIVDFIDRTFYQGADSNWDDERFRSHLISAINSTTRCLEYGAGRGNVKQMNFKGTAKFVAGVDLDNKVLENPFLDEAKVICASNNRIPYPDDHFDMVFADNVMEHVENPARILNEIRRVLVPGGKFYFKTPNKWHYVAISAMITPTWFHRYYNGLRGRTYFDTFPTRYVFNSKNAVERYATECGFDITSMNYVEGRPEYLRIMSATYLLGLVYERIVNSLPLFESFRAVLIGEFRSNK